MISTGITHYHSHYILLARASNNASPDSRVWRNRLQLWMREAAKSNGRVEYIPGWEELWPLNNLSHKTREGPVVGLH